MDQTQSEDSQETQLRGYENIKTMIQYSPYPWLEPRHLYIYKNDPQLKYNRYLNFEIDEDGFIIHSYGETLFKEFTKILHPVAIEAILHHEFACPVDIFGEKEALSQIKSTQETRRQLLNQGVCTLRRLGRLLDQGMFDEAYILLCEAAAVLCACQHYRKYPEVATMRELFSLYPESLMATFHHEKESLYNKPGQIYEWIGMLDLEFKSEFVICNSLTA